MEIHFQPARLNDAEFAKFSALIFSKTGIHLKPEKKELLNARLGKRLRATGLASFGKYYEHVVRDSSGAELIQLIDCVSTNFTSFFREQAHFDFLTATVLPRIIESRGRRSRPLTFWSAACSSGEEPYTLAMVVADYMEKYPGMGFSILATDISTKVLAMAQKGVYSYDKVDKVPYPLLKKYFQKGVGKCSGYVKVKPELGRFVDYQRLNLMDSFPWKEEMDVIFCRNVMIYFTRETQRELVEKFYYCLAPGGYLFIGHSESLSNISHRFQQAATTVYRKK